MIMDRSVQKPDTTDGHGFVDRAPPASLAKLESGEGNQGLGRSQGEQGVGIAACLSANCTWMITIAFVLEIAIVRDVYRQVVTGFYHSRPPHMTRGSSTVNTSRYPVHFV